jgi:Holliday junction resolvase-like predicted endonuclease
MKSQYLVGSLIREFKAASIDDAGARLGNALALRLEASRIRLWLDSASPELAPWLEAVKGTTPEVRGMMVQAFFARMFSKAGYEILVGRELDIVARNRFRTLLIEVKSSLAGGRFGSRAILTQLDTYSKVRERRGAEIWLGTMGIRRPMAMNEAFLRQIIKRKIRSIDIRWISAKETLLPHI